ncbi:hypothetical protein O6H91_19G061900 [Diphasiastrum complanatum]|uniref:Uncharacterized protein n=1 Tax=Diphasiastrum complanatum TaxID=34168 RepID=A0ACC2AVT1_DIPCM|nr:hypothetical protein O6H91_19G061900 [Diphasiastrum complanatum]
MALSLLELCVRNAIDNLAYLRDVGQTDSSLLHMILPHCTAEQLLRIELATKERDLSAITNDLWRGIYGRQFGFESVNLVVERMKRKSVNFKWIELYQAKLKEREEAQQKGVNRLKQLYVEAETQKQSRKIQSCLKVPPGSKRQKSTAVGGMGPSSKFPNGKGRLMKKARLDYAASNEAKIHDSIKRRQALSAKQSANYRKTFKNC